MLEGASLKRIAWSYGCAKKGSDEEEQLRRALLRKAALELALEREGPEHVGEVIDRVMARMSSKVEGG